MLKEFKLNLLLEKLFLYFYMITLLLKYVKSIEWRAKVHYWHKGFKP